MVYSDFSLDRVKNDFGLTLDESRNLFVTTTSVAPSEILINILNDYVPLAIAISTEKARSEFLIAPILAEVRRLLNKQVSLFSGKDFTVDPARGLQGFCDYLISGSQEQLFISAPVMTIFEAKKKILLADWVNAARQWWLLNTLIKTKAVRSIAFMVL
jgi:hypothetical protein